MKKLNRLIRTFNSLSDDLPPKGYILNGSVVSHHLHRTIRGEHKKYGPYYIWTRKIKGKTVTRALTEEQATIIKESIERNREMEKRLAELRSVSEKIIFSLSHSVRKRKRS